MYEQKLLGKDKSALFPAVIRNARTELPADEENKARVMKHRDRPCRQGAYQATGQCGEGCIGKAYIYREGRR